MKVSIDMDGWPITIHDASGTILVEIHCFESKGHGYLPAAQAQAWAQKLFHIIFGARA